MTVYHGFFHYVLRKTISFFFDKIFLRKKSRQSEFYFWVEITGTNDELTADFEDTSFFLRRWHTFKIEREWKSIHNIEVWCSIFFSLILVRNILKRFQELHRKIWQQKTPSLPRAFNTGECAWDKICKNYKAILQAIFWTMCFSFVRTCQRKRKSPTFITIVLLLLIQKKYINYNLDKLSSFSPLLIVCQEYANAVSFPDL